jgi:hypothetical protein
MHHLQGPWYPPNDVVEESAWSGWEFSAQDNPAAMDGLAIARARRLYYFRGNSITAANAEENLVIY